MSEYIDRQAVLDELDEDIAEFVECDYALKATKRYIEEIPPADVVSWAYLERYASWFCAVVSFPEFIREAKAFLKASGGFQEGSQIYD